MYEPNEPTFTTLLDDHKNDCANDRKNDRKNEKRGIRSREPHVADRTDESKLPRERAVSTDALASLTPLASPNEHEPRTNTSCHSPDVQLVQLDFCVRDSIVEQQQNLRARPFLRCVNVAFNKSTGETDFSRASWSKSDSCPCDVHVDPRVTLADHTVYEFVCYNERAFFLTVLRRDKLLPDSEDKINSIVYARRKLTSVV